MASVAPLFESPAEAARATVDAYVAASQRKSLLRLLTCGSVDDGKSTLIGRLLYDSRMLLDDQLAALRDASAAGEEGELDFASLVDGLAAEREQGITIDVAYRFFATDRRKFIIADTPGHEQYTRNMATGASTADLAVILIDARKGVLPQTRRHSHIAHLLGIRHIVLAVNKMDLVGYSRARFQEIVADYRDFARGAGIEAFEAIPVSARLGDNIARRSEAMPWYDGPALLEHLETVPVEASHAALEPFRMTVQWVNRFGQDFRGYAGTIASGRVRVGDRIAIAPSGQVSKVAGIVAYAGQLDEAVAGQAVTLTLVDEVDCSRGDVIAAAESLAVTSALDARLVWMAQERLVLHRAYWLRIGAQTVSASVSRVGAPLDVDGLGGTLGTALGLNDIAAVAIDLDRRVSAVPYAQNRQLGSFVLIDKITNATVAAGLITGFPSTPAAVTIRDDGIFRVSSTSAGERVARAQALAQRLRDAGRPSFVLSEAVLREGVCSDLDVEDETGLAQRAGEVARLMHAAGVTVILAVPRPEGTTLPGIEAVDGDGDGWVI
ncbi:sulfate adenylyltransferase subunit CysN [Sphingosinicella sp. LHD-64]|uniref:sulfate adenylyltransferase subunit CysN n=1 Tax=Sphingosinicella sp. LHD-64 TaxID=3072139 RepID=UPI0028106963|nr:sulfate adenylyltransferase subunit CysN [Sphingosinicella sp. LHD-64]MDQ8757197.1 sulfate adenylyltransferase subunit CysN [Sphingosinicella sp. LHD-64]